MVIKYYLVWIEFCSASPRIKCSCLYRWLLFLRYVLLFSHSWRVSLCLLCRVTMETESPLTKPNPLTKQGRVKFWAAKIWRSSNRSAKNAKIKGKHSFLSYCPVHAKRDPLHRWPFHHCYYHLTLLWFIP